MAHRPFQFGLGGLLALTAGVAVLAALAAVGESPVLVALAGVAVIPMLVGQSIVLLLDAIDRFRE
jgi:hypothetical protein